MKKYLSILALLTMGLLLTTSCSSDDSNDDSQKAPVAQETKSYVSISNATYSEGTMPQATTAATTSAQVASTVQAGGTSVIRVVNDRNYARFFISVKGMPGYWIYTPSTRGSRAAGGNDDFIDIPFTTGSDVTGTVTIQINGEMENGEVTQPYEQTINYTEHPTVRLKSIAVYISGQKRMDWMNFAHNDQGKITSYYCYGNDRTDVNYDGNSITSIINHENGNITYSSISQNQQGFITSMQGRADHYSDNVSFSYDEQGHLTRISISGTDDGDAFTTEHNFKWSADGNITHYSSRTSDEDGTETFSCTYSYGLQENIFRQTFAFYDNSGLDGFPAGIGLFGIGTTNLPIKAISDMYTYTYSYTFNTDGSIKTQTVTLNGNQSVELVYAY